MFEQFPALGARVAVIYRIGISEAQFELEIPVLGQHQGISVRKAGPEKPPLKAVFGERGKVRPEKFEIVLQIAEIQSQYLPSGWIIQCFQRRSLDIVQLL